MKEREDKCRRSAFIGAMVVSESGSHLTLPNESQFLTHLEALLKFSLIRVIVSLRLLARPAAVARQYLSSELTQSFRRLLSAERNLDTLRSASAELFE